MLNPDFEGLLRQRIGLDVEAVGSQVVVRAVQARQKACRFRDTTAYWELLQQSESELQELIEAVVVGETWFFRDREAFAALSRDAVEVWLDRHPGEKLRVLSLPCATGEEPYSIAIALIEAGFPADRFCVDGVDISERALGHARRGRYTDNSFRGANLEFRARHFERTSLGYELSAAIRKQVRFQHGNMFAPGLLPGSGIYHAIFCRNVLIYFDRAAQRHTLEVLTRLLADQGLLFVGPSETSLLTNGLFASIRVPLSFAFRKTLRAELADHAPVPALRRHVPLAKPAAPPLPIAARAPKPGTPVATAAHVVALIEQAAQLADEGKLGEATRLCTDHVRQHGPSARAFHLLGLLSETTGHTREAVDFYRKALYLQPEHLDALQHLTLLLDKEGDTQAAEVLRSRARRLEQKGGA